MSDLLRVLLVEDNPGDAELIGEMLPKHGTTLFEVACVVRLLEALTLIGEDRFDIVLLDLNLPDSDGLATLLTIRERASHLPIVVLTGNSDERVALAAIQEGAQDYLVKGQIDKNVLVRSIKYAVERKQSEEKLRASEEKYRQLHEGMRDAFGQVDLSGLIVDCNGVFLNMLGYTEEEIRDLTYEDLTPKRWHEAEARIINEQVLSRGYSDLYEKEYRRKDGTLVPVELRTVLLRDDAGHPYGMWAVIRDIAERKLAEQSLHESQETIRMILNSTAEGIYGLDLTWKCTFCNPSGIRILGYHEEKDLIGKYMHSLIHHTKADGTPYPQDECPTGKVITKGEYIHGDNDILWRSDGTSFPAEFWAYPLFHGNELVGAVVTFIDISERKSLEKQLLQSQKMEAIGQLAGGVAHDFNNILSTIVGYGYLTLMEMADDDPLRLNIDNMLEGVDRAAHLTKDLMLFSRKREIELKPADLNEIIRKVEKFLLRVIGEDIDLKTVLHENPISILGDTHQLEQVLINFATNARDAMPQGGVFIISTQQVTLDKDLISVQGNDKPGSYALITVSDTGKGMDEETRQRIFEPFFTTKEVGKGTGLGLAVVYGIIKQHDGYIKVDSEPGKGTTFLIYLPAIVQPVRHDSEVQQEEAPARGTETILLAEDDSSLRKLIQTILTQFGYTIIEAANGEEAVRKFQENKDEINLLLFDLIMPKMTGKVAYDEIRKIQPDIKVIFASGYAPDHVRQTASLEKGVSLLFKPASPYELLNKVRSVLDGTK